MMMVPRSYSPPRPGMSLDEKTLLSTKKIRQSQQRLRSKSPFLGSSPPTTKSTSLSIGRRSDPVQIPTRTTRHIQPAATRPTPHTTTSDPPVSEPKVRKDSAKDILSSTSIPARRKPRGRPSQRLPKCDYVADFSKLIADDLKTTPEITHPASWTGSHIDGLFGNIDGLVEGQVIVGSNDLDVGPLSTRSISSDSISSLASPDDYASDHVTNHKRSVSRSGQERKLRHMATSEDCANDHPLFEDEEEAPDYFPPVSPPLKPRSPPPARDSSKSKSFKSTLSSSLKAIRSAAQRASLLSQSHSDDYLARSFFDIQPGLTDDKRPPPGSLPPSPELRRYLNPSYAQSSPESPTQLHFWHDDRHFYQTKSSASSHPKIKTKPKRKIAKSNSGPGSHLPPVVQLSNCLPPSVRTAHASSPPIWLSSDGTPTNKNTSTPLLYDPETTTTTSSLHSNRPREPRENRDFLRVYVCEMAMRRGGKLKDDISTGRARLWLPPVIGQNFKDDSGSKTRKEGKDRWTSLTAEDL